MRRKPCSPEPRTFLRRMQGARLLSVPGLATGLTMALTLGLTTLPATAATPAASPGFQPRDEPAFLENLGQLDPSVAFYSIGSAAGVYFTAQGPVLELRSFAPVEDPGVTLEPRPTRRREQGQAGITRRFAVGVRFVGATGPTVIEPVGDPVGRRRYLGAGGPEAQGGGATGAGRFRQVAYREVWPGIDVIYHAGEDGLVYETRVRPGADPTQIRFDYEGVDQVEQATGTTWIPTPLGTIEDQAPSDFGRGRLRWTVESTRPTRVPDPRFGPEAGTESPELILAELSWGTFLGGSLDEAVYAVAVDAQGRPVVTGATYSADFPTTLGAFEETYSESFDIFVSQLSADGTQLLWSTFIGGTDDDRGWAITLDGAGNPVVAGVTGGNGFPTTPGAFDETPNGTYDAFVLKLAADGSALIWSTFYGGSDREWDVSGLTLDSSGRPVLSGSTRSSDLPTTLGAHDTVLGGTEDAFVARFSADGTVLEYGTYLGGSDMDAAEDVATDPAGTAVVIGRTISDDFPVTVGAFQTVRHPTSQDGFVVRIAADGSSVLLGTYLGAGGTDDPYAVALDDAGEIVVGGATTSTNFPVTVGAAMSGPLGGRDGFVSRLAAAGDTLVWSSYYGGDSTDRVLDLIRDGDRGISLTGWSCSSNLPTTPGSPFPDPSVGPCDSFLGILADDGSRVDYTTYLAGWWDETGYGVAVDSGHRHFVVGETKSTNFPVTPGSFSPVHNSPNTDPDGFVMALQVEAICTEITLGPMGAELHLDHGVQGTCPALPPPPVGIDLIEGRMEALSGLDIGPAQAIQCATLEASVGTPSVPEPGKALYQLARENPGGSYTDGAGAGQMGGRTPSSGDCPP